MGPPLRHVQAAQLRARAVRGGIGRLLLATIFLVGALAYATAPGKEASSSRFWMTALLVLSTWDAGRGLRLLTRLGRKPPVLWAAGTAAWAVLATTLVAFLLRT